MFIHCVILEIELFCLQLPWHPLKTLASCSMKVVFSLALRCLESVSDSCKTWKKCFTTSLKTHSTSRYCKGSAYGHSVQNVLPSSPDIATLQKQKGCLNPARIISMVVLLPNKVTTINFQFLTAGYASYGLVPSPQFIRLHNSKACNRIKWAWERG